MIMIDILVPPMDRIYDFEVDDNCDARTLIDEVKRLIEQRERVKFSVGDREMFSYRRGCFVDMHIPLKSQGIVNGDRLILI